MNLCYNYFAEDYIMDIVNCILLVVVILLLIIVLFKVLVNKNKALSESDLKEVKKAVEDSLAVNGKTL